MGGKEASMKGNVVAADFSKPSTAVVGAQSAQLVQSAHLTHGDNVMAFKLDKEAQDEVIEKILEVLHENPRVQAYINNRIQQIYPCNPEEIANEMDAAGKFSPEAEVYYALHSGEMANLLGKAIASLDGSK